MIGISKNTEEEPYTKSAPNFRNKNPTIKEYIGEEGRTYLVIGDFSISGDNSGLVMRKEKSEGDISVAKYEFCKKRKQKEILKKIKPDLVGHEHTYSQIEGLLEK